MRLISYTSLANYPSPWKRHDGLKAVWIWYYASYTEESYIYLRNNKIEYARVMLQREEDREREREKRRKNDGQQER